MTAGPKAPNARHHDPTEYPSQSRSAARSQSITAAGSRRGRTQGLVATVLVLLAMAVTAAFAARWDRHDPDDRAASAPERAALTRRAFLPDPDPIRPVRRGQAGEPDLRSDPIA
jgi:hypothetical protein